jgi:methylmalonyl-CoA epimerase
MREDWNPRQMHLPLDHIGIAVPSMEDGITLYRGLYSLSVSHRETLEDRGIEIAFLDLANTKIELLAPAGKTPSTISKFLEKHGPGLHHLCYTVPDIRNELARLKDEGIRLVDEEPRPGAYGTLIAFIHPAAAGGVLTELCQYL